MGAESKSRILVVDDDPVVLKRMDEFLRTEGFHDILFCSEPREVASLVESSEIALMLLDLLMPGLSGQKVLEETKARHPEIPVIVVSSMNDIDAAVECMRHGAFDFVPKLADMSRLASSIRHALSIRELQRDYSALKDSLLGAKRPEAPALADMVTADERMLGLFRYVESIATSPKPILIMGESGTGKELMAQAIHRLSGRTGPMVSLNIAGLDDTMFSDSLFGHRRGAFTGADSDRGGLIERAEGGTLFLDEIGELSQLSQVKLLRLIEDRRYYPLGADLPKTSGAAIVTATNRDLRAASATGSFRLDLFYRLQTHLVQLPPLRERSGDLPLLLAHFVRQSARRLGRGVPAIPEELVLLLQSFDFPGNVRELESMVFDAMSGLKGGVLGLESFRRKILRGTGAKNATDTEGPGAGATRFSSWDRLPSLKQAAEELIREALRRSKGNQGIAADLLGISRTALNKRLNANHAGEMDSINE